MKKLFSLRPDRDADAARDVKYPGTRAALDGNTAVSLCEREASDAAGAYPITPSTQMGEMWAENVAAGHLNISGRPLIFIEPEGEHAAAAVTAGLAMTGLRATNFSSGQGIAYMHESLYAAVGKRLTYVLNVGARAMTKSTLNVHAGHDDYHCIDDTGFFQLFAKNAQAAADLNLAAHRIAELALTPGVLAQDGFLTTHLIESMQVPERELIAEYLGRPDDLIECPTPAQRMLYGERRRRIPELWDVDNPVMAGLVQNQDAYMQSVAAQRPFFFDHLRELTDRAFDEYHALTGRRYARVMTYRAEDAEYLILGQGSLIPSAEAVADWLRETRGLKVGVVDLVMFRPFPADLLAKALRGKKGVAVLERLDQPLAVDQPLMRELRAVVAKALENGRVTGQGNGHAPGRLHFRFRAERKKDEAAGSAELPYPEIQAWAPGDAPELYSGSFGLGSRDLQPEGLIAAVENMLPEAKHKKQFYLSIDFLREKALTPKQAIHQETIEESYPHVRELALHGSENPDLMPEGAITVRIHSVGGWGAITTGKNLAMTLFDLLGYHIKANPKYGSEKKGQPTTYYLSAAPEPIRINCEYYYVDAVLSPDPNVFHHTNAVAGLVEGGLLVIQSDAATPEQTWMSIPAGFRKVIADKKIRVFALDAFKIAREEATDPDLQLRMQGIAFQGAFFRASDVAQRAGLDDERLIEAMRDQLEKKFGGKGARVVADNLRVIRRGFDQLVEVPHGPVVDERAKGGAASDGADSVGPAIPVMVRDLPQSASPITDIHRFWEQTGSFYLRGMGNDNLTDPFIGLGVMPAATALFRDMTGIRFQHPEWVPENCTACGKCWTVCPDTAIPGLVHEVGQVLDTVVRRVRKAGHDTVHLPRAVRQIEKHLRATFAEAKETDPVGEMIEGAIAKTLEAASQDQREALGRELDLFREHLDGFRFALTRPYFTVPEKKQKGEGGLLSITVDPYTCKGCMECVEVCDDDALRPVAQTDESVQSLRDHWDFWRELPNTPEKYIQIDDLEEGIGKLETLLLDKRNYGAFTSGDGACLGCSEKTIVHLFTATVEALMRPRVARHVAKLKDLIAKLREHVQRKLIAGFDPTDSAAMSRLMEGLGGGDVTLASIASVLEKDRGGEPIDREWLRRNTRLASRLEDLVWRYEHGTTGGGRSAMGMINATGCTSVWGSTYPFNPYPFPWANHLFQDSPSMAMGVFEGHMAKMAEGFKTVRQAELELNGGYEPARHNERFTYFAWQDFSDEEWDLCPPVVVVGGDGAMYDIGFQNLSRAMMSGKPLKILVVDTQVYSNTGGQACTSGFLGQISDMAQYGKAARGKQEVRKEIGLIGMAHRTTYVLQGAISHPAHMIEGFIRGLQKRRPALFNLYSSCQPEHGIGDDMSARQAKLAVESRAYPLFRYDPEAGKTPQECFDLEGNPALEEDWPTYTLKYRESGVDKSMEVPMTFADFAITEVRFRKHFRVAPPDTWSEDMVPLHDFLELAEDEREGKFPYVWSVDRKQQLSRLLVDHEMVLSCQDRRDFWTMLRALAGVETTAAQPVDIEARVRGELVGRLTSNLMRLVGGEGASTEGLAVPDLSALFAATPAASVATAPAATPAGDAAAPVGAEPGAASDELMAPWIDTDLCTTCDECVNLNPKMFAYDERRKAYIKDPNAGPYSDLVKAAERCTASVIHPGLPKDRSFKDAEKWIKRGEKFN
ncbi:MAG TPA: 2-oxoacid:acceptor oxidoreductase family protein [Thermoanaerobaculia bacterium]|nr:2-oxoacid:acceptor oxidoreductase family protein [Thermoanaerobaculia bacterium]